MGLFDKKPGRAAPAPEATQRYGLLLVDDEMFNLTSLASLLEDEYRVLTAASGADALRLLEDPANAGQIQVIVSDQRMPAMTGVELLRQCKSRWPQLKRVLLTGYTDVEAIIDAINEAEIYKYVRKPVDSHELRLTLARALESWQLEHDYGRLLAELRQAMDRLSLLDAEKLTFLRYLAHEMNTPLNWLSATQVLDRDKLGWDVQEILSFVDQGQDRLRALITAVLRYFQAAGLQPRPGQDLVDLPVLIRERLEQLAPAQAGVAVELEQPETLTIASDAGLLVEMLDHLLENACTHARQAGVGKVTVRLTASGGSLRLVVHNNGRGLEGEALEGLFQAFHFGSDHGEAGFGLSLATARALAQAMGGSLYGESQGGESGVSCCLSLPLKRAA